jgi:hypothetical protein
VSEDFQSHLAALAPGISAADEGFEATLEHGEYSFDLNAISIGCSVESGLHQPPVVSSGRLVSRPAPRRRNERAALALLAGKAMIGFES